MNNLKKYFFGYTSHESSSLNTGMFLVRLYVGLTIMGAGLDKLPLTDWMVDQVSSMGFPFPIFFGWLASFSEFAFGLMLLLGLMTRSSSIMLAITMGVASFGFQKVIPVIDMHIAQLYFWSFVMFAAGGAGTISLDRLIYEKLQNSKQGWLLLGPSTLILLVIFGLYREINTPGVEENISARPTIESISIPGTFNDWDPSANIMIAIDTDTYYLDLEVDKAGPIQFKFTTNESWDYHLGETDQSSAGFPLRGMAETNDKNSTENIEAYLPVPGTYRFDLKLDSLQYSLDSISVISNTM